MNRDELARGIAATCRVLGEPYVVVFGSQSILGSFDENDLPPVATMSREMDVSPWTAFVGSRSSDEIAASISAVNVYLGEDSHFDSSNNFYVEAISKDTVLLPNGWDSRLVSFKVDVPGSEYGFTGLCLDPHDLCVAKSLAGREHDRVFVSSLISSKVVSPELIVNRLNGEIQWTPWYPHDEAVAVSRALNLVRHISTTVAPRTASSVRANEIETCGAITKRTGQPCLRRGRCPFH